jgi:hypothetical protein
MPEQIDPTAAPAATPGDGPAEAPSAFAGVPPAPPAPVPATGVSFRMRTRGPELLQIGVVAAAGLAVLIAATIATGASPSPSTSQGAGASPAASGSPGTRQGDKPSHGGLGPFGRGPFGFGGAFGPGGPLGLDPSSRFGRGIFGDITVTAIDGSRISLKTGDGWTRTITITSATTITKGGASAAAGDLKVGDAIRFRQTRNSDGTFTINSIDVVVPQVAGTVSAVTADGFTIKDRDGVSWTVTVAGSTVFRTGAGTGSKSDVKEGVNVVVAGSQSGNTISATTVFVRLPTVVGKVTARTDSTLTVQTPGGTTMTIHVSGSTMYRVAGKDNAGLSDITVGSTIVAQGTQRADGSLDASAIASGNVRRFPVKPNRAAPSASPASAG